MVNRALLILGFLWPLSLVAGEPWTRFRAESALDFEVPAALVLDPKSNEGEAKWVSYLNSPDGAFKLESNGFIGLLQRAAQRASKRTSREFLISELRKGGGDADITYQRFTRHYLVAVYVDRQRNQKSFLKYWIGSPNANIAKSLTISYPWDRRAEFDPWLARIEASWDPAAYWR